MPSTRHTYELLNRLERVLDRGCAEITDRELRRWYGQERVGVTVWRDIYERWMELHPDPEAEASILTAGTGYGYIFMRGDGLITNKTHWVELRDRARLSASDRIRLAEEANAEFVGGIGSALEPGAEV